MSISIIREIHPGHPQDLANRGIHLPLSTSVTQSHTPGLTTTEIAVPSRGCAPWGTGQKHERQCDNALIYMKSDVV